MSDIIKNIEQNMSKYGSSQKHLAKFILNNQESIPNMTITALAKSAYCSPSSVSRFINKIGYDSYFEFCHDLKIKDKEGSKHNTLLNAFSTVDSLHKDNVSFNELMVNINQFEQIYIMSDTFSSVVERFTHSLSKSLEKDIYYSANSVNNKLILKADNCADDTLYLFINFNLNSLTLPEDKINSLLLLNFNSKMSKYGTLNYVDYKTAISSNNQVKHYIELYVFDSILNII